MDDDDIDGAVNDRGLVKIHWRHWDGIDRPDHYYSKGLNPNRARNFAQSLMKAADEADKFVALHAEQTLIELKNKRNILDHQISELEKTTK